MRRAALLLLLLPCRAEAQDPPALGLRLSGPEGPVWLGQHVGLTAILRTPIRFASPPGFPEPAVEGRAIILPGGTTTPGSEREGGVSYVLLQHRYDLFPASAGALTIRSLHMAVPVGGDGGSIVSAEAESPPLRLEVRLPPGTTDPGRLVTAPSLQLEVGLEGDPARVRVGEAVTRSVTLTAEDSAAMLLPPMPWSAPDGVRAYPDPPRLTDHADRGVLSAMRVDRAAFVPQAAGQYLLPGATMQWFEPRSGRMQVLTVPPLAVTAVAGAAPEADRAGRRLPALAGTILLLGGLAAWLVWRHRSRGGSPEAAAFAELRRACRRGNARGAMAALLRWTALATPPGMPVTAVRLAAISGVPDLATEAERLAASLYTAGTSLAWNGRALLAAARRARRAHPARSGRGAALPGLNPGRG